MDTPRVALAPRIAATLHERQFLVFFAIALYGLDAAAALLSAWLRHHHGLPRLLQDESGPLYDLFVTGRLSIAVLAALSTALGGWLRVIYIRALLGRERPAEPGAFSVWSMIALVLGTDLVVSGLAALVTHSGGNAASQAYALAVPAVMLATLYADYAIVISDVGPLASLGRSWSTVRATLALSLAAVFALTLLNLGANLLPGQAHGSTVSATALLVVQVFAVGSLQFVADVALITVYRTVQETIRSGGGTAGGPRRLPPPS
jgi:hypothetical protein